MAGRTTAGRAGIPEPAPELARKGTYTLITDLQTLDEWLSRIREAGRFAFDSETDSLDALKARPVGFSFAVESGEACYVPLRGPEGPVLDEEEVRRRLKPVLEDSSLELIAQNAKYDYKVLKRWGLTLSSLAFDTMVAGWLLDTTANSFGLDELARSYLGYTTVHYADLFPDHGRGRDYPPFYEVPLETAADYAAEDADITFRLYTVFEPLLAERGFDRLFYDLELPLVPVLAEMELRGIRIDTDMLAAYSRELDGLLASIEEEIYELCGREFNIASTKQLQEVLFVERKLKPVKKTKTGYSTDVAVLQELAREDPVPEKVLRHRLLSKLRSTYVDALPKLVNPETGRLHTHFTQTGTATGRLSSKDPNLQNIPIRDEEGRRIRTAFVPADGWVFVSADYSQIELVVLAHLSGDPGLTRAFREGKDVHRETGALIFGVPAEEVTSAQRRIAKTINFGVMYGMSSFRLSRELNISRDEAERFIEAYFRTYPNIKSFVEETVRQAETHGAVRTLLGRERPLPDITSRNRTVKSGAERIAVNTPIQGTAADIVKRAMLRVSRRLAAEGGGGRILLQVHDELILEAPARNRRRSRAWSARRWPPPSSYRCRCGLPSRPARAGESSTEPWWWELPESTARERTRSRRFSPKAGTESSMSIASATRRLHGELMTCAGPSAMSTSTQTALSTAASSAAWCFATARRCGISRASCIRRWSRWCGSGWPRRRARSW